MVSKSQFLNCSIYIVVGMKVSIAVIKLVLRTNKVLSDGSHPIMLRCSFNGMKERSSGYSCLPRYWDKKNECVKKGYPNFVMVNAELKKLKDEAIARRDRFIASNEVYTPSMVLARDEVRNAVTNDFRGLIQRYIDEKGLESKTIEKWWVVYRSVSDFVGRNDFLINEVDEGLCRRYCRWLEEKGMASGSIKSYMGKVVCLLHYGVSLDLINKYPLDGWKYHKDYRESKSELYIHSRTLDVMMEMFLDELIVRKEGGLWSYREGVTDKLMDIHSELYSHYLYMIGIWMKGISPVDISLLKKKDLKVVMIRNINCYAIDGHRSKTGMLFKIRIPQNCLESNVLIRTMLMFGRGEYFLPTLEGYVGKDIKKRVNNVYSYHSEHLVDWFQRINEEIARRNVMNGDDIPLIDLECRYYSYRHSFIMREIQKPNVNLLALAQTVGKSSHTLHQYISLLGDVDLV